MKKWLTAVLIMCLTWVCLAPSAPASAASAVKNVVIVDAKTGYSFLPVRSLTEFKGVTTQWNDAAKQLDIFGGNHRLTLHLAQKSAAFDGTSLALAAAPFRENGSVYVPLSLIVSKLGVEASWQKDDAAVKLTRDGVEQYLPYVTRNVGQALKNPIVSARQTYKVGGRSFSAQTVTIDLLHPEIQLDVVLAGNTPGKVEDLSSIAKRSGAKVAVNGTFFDAYTSGAYKAPYGYIVSHGTVKMPSPGDKRSIFAYDANHLARIIAGPDFGQAFEQGWIDGGLQAGPRLLVNGKVSLNVKKEGFKDPKILTGGGARSALGLTRDHRLILLTTGGATIPQLAEIMKKAGAYQAMNLDGGASSGLYYNDKYLTTPGRKISNALVVKFQ
ncbi:phosphodiester glycosidase family protein [Paenibacillus sp. Y412MC10]|uniref:phosphodiester glycosidase family protein n=1 Tax=Geobacillus sp. (strain Y412MC10) TaxID=481743 RepID=UPI0011A349EC|nr:phosphodiester glycosidase family protein [Paenibacillus sp. Y412MC10]